MPYKTKKLEKRSSPKSATITRKTPKVPKTPKTPKATVTRKTPKVPKTPKAAVTPKLPKVSKDTPSTKKVNSVQKWLDDNLKLREFVIFGAYYCSFCEGAKTLARDKNLSYSFFDIDKLPKTHLKLVKAHTKNYNYIPIVFHRGKFIGGYDAMVKIASV